MDKNIEIHFETKSCDNCKHQTMDFFGDHYGGFHYKACGRAPVLSEYGNDIVQWSGCDNERTNNRGCGVDGKYFLESCNG